MKNIKKLVKRNKIITNLYIFFYFLRSIRIKDLKDFLNIPKIKIIFLVKLYTKLVTAQYPVVAAPFRVRRLKPAATKLLYST